MKKMDRITEFKNQCYELAGIPFCASYRYGDFPMIMGNRETVKQPLFSIKASEESFTEEKEIYREGVPRENLESLILFRRFCEAASAYQTILFHSCAVVTDGKAYLFGAPSGTGKSTHVGLWTTLLKDKARILNGDKPLLRRESGTVMVYDSPFRGKEGFGYLGAAPLSGLCFLHRGTENRIQRISSSEAVKEAYIQTYLPKTVGEKAKVMETLIGILNEVPLYSLSCTISEEAARVAYEAMHGGMETYEV